MQASKTAALAWIILLGLAAWVIGVYPTYRLAGLDGLAAQGAASIVVLLATSTSAMIIAKLATRGPTMAAMGLLLSGFVRLIVVVGATFAVMWMFDLPLLVLVLWMGLFYVAMLSGEVIWLARAIHHDDFLTALGDINRWGISPPTRGGDEEAVS
ncbi:MAG: hypothetical protein QGH60_12005 [Phycisphaerae bacterium]|jgi:hypothetical protein|nr:hypothetical protein [Phycisphaerae bacterium]